MRTCLPLKHSDGGFEKMTKSEAFSFLEKHQPMPCDDQLTKQEIEEYDEVRKFFLNNLDVQCVPLLLNSFGGRDGFGVYQLVEDVILMYSKDVVLPHILNALNNSCKYVVYWNVQIASNFPDANLFNPLTKTLEHNDEDIKLASIIALAQLGLNDIHKKEVISVLKNEHEIISDEEVKKFVEEVLKDIQ